MGRLVVVSNRLADPRKPAAGGLAVALGETLKKTGGLWFGWSGKVVENGAFLVDMDTVVRNRAAWLERWGKEIAR